jgi:hypothetical protein
MRRLSLLISSALVLGAPSALAESAAEQRWQAELQGQGEFQDLNGQAEATSAEGSTTVRTSIAGAPGGGTHPWHIHEGACGSGGSIVGSPGAYEPLQPDSEGQASTEAQIDVALEPDQDYHVKVHASPEDPGTIVACGDLRNP